MTNKATYPALPSVTFTSFPLSHTPLPLSLSAAALARLTHSQSWALAVHPGPEPVPSFYPSRLCRTVTLLKLEPLI